MTIRNLFKPKPKRVSARMSAKDAIFEALAGISSNQKIINDAIEDMALENDSSRQVLYDAINDIREEQKVIKRKLDRIEGLICKTTEERPTLVRRNIRTHN